MANVADILTDNLGIWTSAIERRSSAGRGRSKRFNLYGIEKLRALILDLAVRGKLVPQDPSEEPASVLLESIAKDRKNTLNPKKENFRTAPKVLDRPLPNGWCIARLDRLAHSQAGFAFKSNGFNEIGEGFPLIRIRDVGLQFSGTYYSGEYRDEFVVTEGDYLISMDGEFRVAVWTNGPALLNQRVSRLQFYSDKIAKKYVVIDLQKQLSKLQGVKAYTTVDHLSGKQISEAEIALPPLAEQHRIVAKVDELMALCNRLEAQTCDAIEAHELLVGNLLATLTRSQNAEELAENWSRIESHFDTLFTTEASIDQLKQTVLQLAVMGKLVPQDPNDEPATGLIRRLHAARTQLIQRGEAKRTQALQPITQTETPFAIPRNWQWVHFEDLTNPAYAISYGVLVPGENEEGGIPFVRIADLSISLPSERPEKSISPEIDAQYERTRLIGGEILMGVVGSIGKLGIAPESWRGANIARAVCRIVPSDIMSKEYIIWLLQSDFMQSNFRGNTRTLAQPTLNINLIRSSLTPLPPVGEQRRIAEKVAQLYGICEALKARLAERQRQQIQFADAVVSKAVA
ncbi:MAG: restriction endonuclease subunit S [Burkholderiales bacterium]|nr:restriction endonuclease subunit S [Burkholderiales bacterium]